jgi:uncharacterized repeat protein (TIGR01451 family)
VQVGHPVRYVVTLENAGPDAANGALFADPIPAALTGVTWSCVAQGGAVCPQANGAGNALSQTIANFPSGGELTYTITALAPATAQTLSSTATINPPTGITDPNLANNTSTVRTAVTTTAPSGADLAISKVGPATIGPKQTVTYSIVVLNNGPNAANGAVVSDAVPSALTNVTATCSATGGALCQLPIAPGNNVNATIALLPAGGSATVTITGTSPQTGTFTNVATVTPPAGVDDPNPGNNVSGAVETAVVSAAVSGSVWVDYNLNHRRDPNEPGVPGFTVQLLANGIVVASTTTDANGQYSIANVPPGVYALRFVDPASGAVFGTPVNGENGAPNPDSNAVIGDGIIESITLKPGINIVQQSLPVDPTGIIYDSVTRQALGGATVTLVGPPGFNPATGLVGGAANVSQVTGASGVAAGFFQFLLVNLGAPGGAPAGTYTIEVKPPAGYLPPNATQGGVEPPQGTFAVPGPIGSESAIQPQPTPPPVGSNGVNTRYYFKLLFSAASGAVVNDDIPLDHASGGALTVQKTGSLSEANIGDAVLYTVLVQSAQASLSNVTVTDTLPRGFTYIKGTATVNNARVPDPVGSPGPSLSFVVGAVSPSSPATITYRVRIGVGAQQGDGVNHARASTPGGASSNVATFRVKVGGGVFTTEACVIGKVYVDCNGNRIQDPGEPGIPGVRLYFSDGTFVVTDSEGKYSYCGLPATTHTLKVDRATLPPGAEMVVSSNRNALDPMSLFIDLKNGELHQADFIEGSCSKSVIHAVDERRGRDEVDAPASEKGPSPALHFESKPISNPNSQGVLP